ncbi:hypothetical protein J0H58_27835 [bacterium]|nr:hypothetical protein [bacterium]
MGRMTPAVPPPPRRVSVAVRLARGLLGFCLGWVWSSAGSLAWLGALAAGYGGLDEGLSRLKDEAWAPLAMAAYFGSVAGSWAGGTVGPMAVGPTRRRYPVVGSSLIGGGLGGVLAAAVGAAAGWAVWRGAPKSPLVLLIPMSLGVPLGVAAGWVAGRAVGRGGPDAARVTDRSGSGQP